MTLPRITATHGDKDGLRWGNVRFAHHVQRRWTRDLITGDLRLYKTPMNRESAHYTPDTDPRRVAQCRAALRAHGL